MSRFTCIYHKACPDGFTAAWVVRNALGADNVNFYGAGYEDSEHDLPSVSGKTVFMVDFTYPRDTIIKLARSAAQIIILDHHKTAKEDLVDLPANVEVHFDMDRSGAGITWDYFHPDENRPDLVSYIEDRDLWRHRLVNSREVNAAIMTYEYSFETWDRLAEADSYFDLAIQGSGIVRKIEKDITEFAQHNTQWLYLHPGLVVPALNLPYFYASEAGNHLAKKAPAGAVWFLMGDGSVKISLRSAEDNPDHVDVSSIAKIYGGGGHKHAASFILKKEMFSKFQHMLKNS